jgi:hypothetical protein
MLDAVESAAVATLWSFLTIFPWVPATFTEYVAVMSLFLPLPVLTSSIALPVNGTEPDLFDDPKVMS